MIIQDLLLQVKSPGWKSFIPGATFVAKWSVTGGRSCEANNCWKIITASFGLVAQFGFDTFDRLLCIVRPLSPLSASLLSSVFYSRYLFFPAKIFLPSSFYLWHFDQLDDCVKNFIISSCDKNKLWSVDLRKADYVRGTWTWGSSITGWGGVALRQACRTEPPLQLIQQGGKWEMACSCHRQGFVECHLQYATGNGMPSVSLCVFVFASLSLYLFLKPTTPQAPHFSTFSNRLPTAIAAHRTPFDYVLAFRHKDSLKIISFHTQSVDEILCSIS